MPIDMRQLSKVAKEMTALRRDLHIAEARAVKRAGTSVKVAQAKEIGAELNLRAGKIRDEVRIRSIDARAVAIFAKRRGVPLKDFGARQTRKGLSVKVLKSGPRALLRAAFELKTKGAHAYGRAGVGSRRYGSPHVGRTPIVKLFGPSPADRLATEPVQRTGAKTWQDRILIELRREEAFALRKHGMK